MTELLTESFCERCGTRYTFQTAAPKRDRLTRLRVMSKGLRRYVLDDETTLEDAFAEAQSEEERAISSQQLEAFHQTFNFCMSCRQYTCANCWNTVEARCLTCAPDLSSEVLPAPFPCAEQVAALGGVDVLPASWPEADLGREGEAVGDDTDETAGIELIPEDRLAAVLGMAAVARTDETARPGEAAEAADAAGEGLDAIAATWDEALGTEALAAADAAEAAAEPAMAATEELEVEAMPAEAIGPASAPASAAPVSPMHAETPEERAAAAAAATSMLLGRFRPGQDLDEVLDAYERDQAAAVLATTSAGEVPSSAQPAAPEPVAPVEPMAPAEPVANAAEIAAAAALAATAHEAAEPASEAADAAPEAVEPEAAEPEAAEPAPAIEPAPAARPPERDDRVEIPVWSIVAPETELPEAMPPPSVLTPQPRAMPEWPTLQASATPEWPADPFATVMPSPAARAQHALWAASSAEVAQKAAAVRSCGSCGLSLSATARFCRRCGAPQA